MIGGNMNEKNEPYYIYLQNTDLNVNVQKYVNQFIQHISNILEKDDPNKKRLVSFLPERNGILLFGFKKSTINIIYKFLKKMDEEKSNINFEINLVLVESHKMTSGFEF
jgi:translation initiation factor 2 beta subunit (eIF-2beta)/eIF-5